MPRSGLTRESYNAKARQSTAGSRKKGKKKKQGQSEQIETVEDPNSSILELKSKEDKEKDRRARLSEELASQADSKWTTKKKKRLEKYIDKKLKKEERLVLFEKLAQTQASLSSALLQSSSTLGTGKPSTHQELQETAEDREVKRALDGRVGKRRRTEVSFDVRGSGSDESDEDDLPGHSDEKDVPAADTDHTQSPVPKIQIIDLSESSNAAPQRHNLLVVGGALQRNADGTVVPPKVRPKRIGKQRGWEKQPVALPRVDSDTSFDSSDSEFDTDSEEERGSDCSGSDKDEREESPEAAEFPPVKKKSLGFKDWAVKQLNSAKGYGTPKPEPTSEDYPAPPRKKRKLEDPSASGIMRGPLGEDLKLPDTSFAKHLLSNGPKTSTPYIKSVEVKRSPEIEASRIMLPIVTEEHLIMEAILMNPVVIICGETGSGKTTQVPQFLYEAGFGVSGSENPGMIGITQPRRVAAMSMASRVAQELALTSSQVSYQIRYDATVSPSTSLKFMTDGVLLRELATDFLLTKYSVIIIDEAHERSMNTDILIGVLSRVIKLREQMWNEGKDIKPLRLIIMSATLRVGDFSENKTLFATQPPVINIAARQHPVTIHFSRRTYSDYVTQAIKKTFKIHTRLPPGGILIFLTGQNEIAGVCRKLESKFGQAALVEKKKRHGKSQHQKIDAIWNKESDEFTDKRTIAPSQADLEVEDVELGNAPEDLAADVDGNMDLDDPDALDSDEDEDLNQELGLEDDSDVPMHVVPLYSLLSSDKQMRVFDPPPPDCRLVVVATNIAETSLTIPGIRYVVDCGRAKERHYDVTSGIQAFRVSWIAKASAAQRAGRAGRTGPGHCYRLYSSALFENHFEKYSKPEIQRIPIEGVVLQMKSMHIDAVVNFPFPTPPDRMSLQRAEKRLTYLGALTVQAGSQLTANAEGQVTDLGRAMALFPLSPRFSRMLVSGQQHGCLPYIICIVSALSVGDPFLYEESLDLGQLNDDGDDETLASLSSEAVKVKEKRQSVRKAFFKSQHLHSSLGGYASDIFKVLSVVGAYEFAGGGQEFCSTHFVRSKAMEEIHKLRAQISNIVNLNFPQTNPQFIPQLPPPTDRQLKALRQLLTAGFIDQVAVRKDILEKNQSTGAQYATSKGVPYKALGISDDVYIHPSSLLANAPPPDYVIFQEVIQTSRLFMKGLTIVNPSWLWSLGKNTICTSSKCVKNNNGIPMIIPRFGPDGWELPAMRM